MSTAEMFLLLGVGVLAGIVSVVASLASLVSYPALLAVGLPPLAANVTNTVALVFASVGSAAGSRPELAGQGQVVLKLAWVSAAGGAAGAGILLLAPEGAFERVAPWLIAVGSLVLLARPKLKRRDAVTGRVSASTIAQRAAVFLVAVYVGYFGAAGGVLMLAVLTTFLVGPLARTNAVKNVIAGAANAVASLGFFVFGPVHWLAALALGVGFLVGGWLGPSVVRRLPGEAVRIAVSIAGLGVACRLAYVAYC